MITKWQWFLTMIFGEKLRVCMCVVASNLNKSIEDKFMISYVLINRNTIKWNLERKYIKQESDFKICPSLDTWVYLFEELWYEEVLEMIKLD